jgi:hypothetical protein
MFDDHRTIGQSQAFAANSCEVVRADESGRRVSNPRPSAWEADVRCPVPVDTGDSLVRALGRAWVDSDGNGGWRRRPGRSPGGALTEGGAAERMLALVREHDAEQLERDAEERRRRGVSFRELAAEYLRWLADVKGAKPSTLRDHRCLLAEPGQAYRSGRGSSPV